MIEWIHKDDMSKGGVFKIVHYSPSCFVPYYGKYITINEKKYLEGSYHVTPKASEYKTLEAAQDACEDYQVSIDACR